MDSTSSASTPWLSRVDTPAFRRQHFGKAPFAEPSGARDAVPLLTWKTVEAVLQSPLPLDVLMVRDGALLEQEPVPHSLQELRALFATGGSVVIRRAEDHDAGLRALGEAFGHRFGGPATVHIFTTPKGHHSFGWHYDCEDVFIAQTGGRKDYFLRKNTVNPHPRVSTMPRDLQFEQERTPIASCTLIPGDWIYLPGGWWHVARCVEESLSISVGVLGEHARS